MKKALSVLVMLGFIAGATAGFAADKPADAKDTKIIAKAETKKAETKKAETKKAESAPAKK